MKTIYTIGLNSKNINEEDFNFFEVLATFANKSEAESAYKERLGTLQQQAEKDLCDLELVLYEGEEGDELKNFLDHDYADFIGLPTDGKVALVIKPSQYTTRYQVVSGDGKTERYFSEIGEQTKCEIIDRDSLNAQRLISFGFPEWFANDYAIDSELM